MTEPFGWNTWNVKAANALVCLPEKLQLKICFYNPVTREYTTDCRSANIKRLGHHAPDGSYLRIDLRHKTNVLTLEAAACGPGRRELAVRLTPWMKGDELLLLFVKAEFIWGGEGAMRASGDGMEAGGFELHAPDPHRIGAIPPESGIGLIFDYRYEAVSRFCVGLPRTAEEIDAVLARAEADHEASLRDGLHDIITRGVCWNTHFEPESSAVMTTLSREWCSRTGAMSFGNYVTAGWDTFFHALLAAEVDEALAYRNVEANLAEVTAAGFVPNIGSSLGRTEDRSEPPVGGYIVWKLYERFGDKAFLARNFSKLLKWHDWWFTARKGSRGMLSWGSDPEPPTPRPEWQQHNLQAAKYESGWDNSPLWDEAGFVPAKNVMDLSPVCLNSLWAADALALSRMAAVLGFENAASRLSGEYEDMKARINDMLWCEERGAYLNKRWDGCFSPILSPTAFYPLLAGIAGARQAERLVGEHLLNPGEFWGEFAIPSIARNENGFGDNDYWRGRIWAPVNYLVYEGLVHYGFDGVAAEFADKSLNLFMIEWRRQGHIYENYNADTGEGGDVDNAEADYTWGLLLPYIALDARRRGLKAKAARRATPTARIRRKR